MDFSNRDGHRRPSILRSQSGQGILEYILVLVVTVGLVLGGLYQLNMAFKSWANNYFGDYIACLLETGELPNVDGAPGDSGICNQLFQPFSLSSGRPLLKPGKGQLSSGGGSGGRGNRENAASGPGGAAGNYLPMSSFGNNSGSRGGLGAGTHGGADSTYTGSTAAGSYGLNGSTNSSFNNAQKHTQLDTRFAFDNEAKKAKRQNFFPTRKSASDEFGAKTHLPFPKQLKKDKAPAPDSPMTFGNFLRFLIIAAIIIALVIFLGGQMLQITKSME